jgi:UDP-GlcNAc:undecaprenyl-phosphate GlcNAc-1-phosphate transferase
VALTRRPPGGRLARINHRGQRVAAPLGLVILLAALGTLAVLRTWSPLAGFASGVGLLGLVDDASPPVHGVRAHLRVLRAGRPDSGVIKAGGTLLLALLTVRWLGFGGLRAPLATGVLVLAPHAFNLLDVRPGRALKAFALLAVALLTGAAEAPALAAFLGPVLAIAPYDLRERAMLGDSGASLVGGLAGLWLVCALGVGGLGVALLALAIIAVYGEVRSISVLVANVPLLRSLDSIGRRP